MTKSLRAFSALIFCFVGCGDNESAAILPDAGPPDGPAPVRDQVFVLAGQTSTGFADGVGMNARFSGPAGAALAPDGSALFVADTFNNLIRRVDLASGAVTTVAGRLAVQVTSDGMGTMATFASPRAMAVSPDNSAIYLADGPTIRRVAIGGTWEVTTVAGAAGMAGYVDGVGDAARLGFLQHSYAFSQDGALLYIADRSNRVLRTFNPTTREVRTAAGTPYTGAVQHVDGIGAAARFSGLGGLAWAGAYLYIVDTFNQCIRRFDPSDSSVTTVAGNPAVIGNADGIGAAATFTTPQSAASDGTSLWVTGFNGLVRRLHLADARVETVLGSSEQQRPVDGAKANARFGVAFGPPVVDRGRGILYYQDRDASSTRAIDLTTLVTTTLAGAKEPTGEKDGALLDARFADPSDLVCDAAGRTCYVADESNHTIRKIDRTTGLVSTLAGAAGSPGDADGPGAQARLAAPRGLALDERSARLFVADTANHTIRAINLGDGVVSTFAGAAGLDGSVDGVGPAARFSSPGSLALTRNGAKLYVADTDTRIVRTIEIGTRAVTTLVGTPGAPGGYANGAASEVRFRSLSGLALSSDESKLFVTDGSSQTLRTIELSTRTTTLLAGADGVSGPADGPAADARFRSPQDLLVSGDSLIVADVSNNVIRRIELKSGMVSTWMGNVVRPGNPPQQGQTTLRDATFFFPSQLARSADDLLIVAENAILAALPKESW